MATYTYNRTINSTRLWAEIQTQLDAIQHIETTDNNTAFIFFSRDLTGDEIQVLDGLVASHVIMTQAEYIAKKFAEAVAFGRSVIKCFIEENIGMGITQAGMTNSTRKVLREVSDALKDGSLYDAIYELREIPDAAKDGVFINNDRLLTVINKLETYLQLPLSESV